MWCRVLLGLALAIFFGFTDGARNSISPRVVVTSGIGEKLSTSTPQKIGMAFGIAGGFLLIALCLWFFFRRWSRRNPGRSPMEIFSRKKRVKDVEMSAVEHKENAA
jgi:hypothetical protein